MTLATKDENVRTHFNESDLVWASVCDGIYDVKVYRLAPYKAVLVVTHGDDELGRKDVGLSYDSRFGPDMGDIEEWQIEGAKIVDGKLKPNS